MRTIIIIQALIIILGGLYFYSLTKDSKTKVEDTGAVMVIPAENTANVRPNYTPPTENPPEVEASSTVKVNDTPAHSDAGMEFPTMDIGTSANQKAEAN